jgi:hypothetical protein
MISFPVGTATDMPDRYQKCQFAISSLVAIAGKGLAFKNETQSNRIEWGARIVERAQNCPESIAWDVALTLLRRSSFKLTPYSKTVSIEPLTKC